MQIFFLDYIYDQQDLYNHYDEQFYKTESNTDEVLSLSKAKKSNETSNNEKTIKFPNKGEVLKVKTNYLPFDSQLKRIEDLVKDFKSKNDREVLSNLKRGNYHVLSYGQDNYNSDNYILNYTK